MEVNNPLIYYFVKLIFFFSKRSRVETFIGMQIKI